MPEHEQGDIHNWRLLAVAIWKQAVRDAFTDPENPPKSDTAPTPWDIYTAREFLASEFGQVIAELAGADWYLAEKAIRARKTITKRRKQPAKNQEKISRTPLTNA